MTLNLFEGDYARLQEIYPAVTAGVAIRKLVRKHIETIEAKAKERVKDE